MLLYQIISVFFIGLIIPDLCFDYLYWSCSLLDPLVLYYRRMHAAKVRYIVNFMLFIGLLSIVYNCLFYYTTSSLTALLSILFSGPFFVTQLGPAFDRLAEKEYTSDKEKYKDVQKICNGHLILLAVCVVQVWGAVF